MSLCVTEMDQIDHGLGKRLLMRLTFLEKLVLQSELKRERESTLLGSTHLNGILLFMEQSAAI